MNRTQREAIELMALKDIVRACNLHGVDFFALSQTEKEAYLAIFKLGIEFISNERRKNE